MPNYKKYEQNRPPLTSMPIDGKFERWHIDFFKLSKTTGGYQYPLLIVDSLTQWIEAFLLKKIKKVKNLQNLFLNKSFPDLALY